MVGLVIASHGQLGRELLHTAEAIIGPMSNVASCSVEPGASAEDIKKTVGDAVHDVDQGEGVIVFADLLGGSPCTQSLSLCLQRKLEVVTGVNLPLLLKANSLRTDGMPLLDLARSLAQYGQKTITCASAMLKAARSSAA